MVYQTNYGVDNSKELAYDLRQKLAEQLGELRAGILEARSLRDYPRWLSLMDSLFIEISQKLGDKEMGRYNEIMVEINETTKNNHAAFNNPKLNGNDIYLSLRKMNIWLNKQMEKYDMFGSKPELEGL